MKHKQYVAAWKRVIQACNKGEDIQICLEWSRTLTSEAAREEFLKALHHRINKRGGLVTPGKPDYYVKALRDQAKLRASHRGIIVRYFETKEVKKRFSHLLLKD
jgi:hypothetical protein